MLVELYCLHVPIIFDAMAHNAKVDLSVNTSPYITGVVVGLHCNLLPQRLLIFPVR